MTREWEADTYHRIADPQAAWNAGVLDRLDPRGDERVLDAGCGSGRGTAALIERLPNGSVVGVDGSAAMIEQARATLGDDVELIHSDLLELQLEQPVDAIVSTATFHWIDDHGRLFWRLAECLKPGGRIETDCGGAGNIQASLEATEKAMRDPRFSPSFADFRKAWYFRSPDETIPLLEAAGLQVDDCWLSQEPTTVTDPREFVRVVQCGTHLDALDPSLHESFLDAVMEQLGDDPVFQYVRLNISARKNQ